MEKLTVCKAEHPQAGDGHLGEVILVAGAVVRWIVHLLVGVQPLVSQHRDKHKH